MTDEIWFIPPDAALTVLPSVLTAQNEEQFLQAAQPVADDQQRMVDEYLKAIGTQLSKDGIGSRIVDWLVVMLLKLSGVKPPQPEALSLASIFSAQMMIAETRPTVELSMTTDEVLALTAALRDRIGAIISADRGVGPMRVELPQNALDFLDEGRSLSAEEDAIFEISKITAYWPPVSGKPGLALIEQREDNGLPIHISMLAQDRAGHDQLLECLERHGGALSQG
ncbi:hypothetical protein JJJ17_01205 [Paracoccus caeni]|uniref:Uncharacterized protein n=1 Tax=Paracoccus caeni TaxID=657651 RepID=A0A934S8X2_9RHOB|nr:hypothetical protein [Paracoccus caeni]MBK4214535.1 hypothetical protein [Paracoccus caeni]